MPAHACTEELLIYMKFLCIQHTMYWGEQQEMEGWVPQYALQRFVAQHGQGDLRLGDGECTPVFRESAVRCIWCRVCLCAL